MAFTSRFIYACAGRAGRCMTAVALTVLTITGLTTPISTAHAAGQATGRHAAMVIDANTGRVLYEQAPDEPRYPASLTKMMTLYIVFELMEQGRLQPSTRIRISDEAAGTQPSKLGLAPDSEIAVSDAIRALVTKSANDIAVALAEHIAGTEAKFAALMTRKAHQLGMKATTFRNAHGLPDSGQVTTARDMLTLAMHLSDDFPRQFPLFSLRSFSYQGKTYANHNTMLGTYAGMDGLKTGYTTHSGFNLVASVRRNGRHVVAAVFGGNTASARNVYMRAILDRSLPQASTEKTRTPATVARLDLPERQATQRQANQRPADNVPADRPLPNRRAKIETAAQPALIEPVRAVEIAPANGRVEPALAPATSAPVQMARVHPVIVAPRRPVTVADVPRVQAIPDERPQPQLVSINAPSPAANAPVATAPVAPTMGVASQPPLALGAAPSSLQVQAQRMQRGAPPVTVASAPAAAATGAAAPPPRAKVAAAPARTGPPAVHGLVALQVGAYGTEAEAKQQLASVREKSAGTLAGASASTQAVQAGGRQLYRARFVGLDPALAASTCTELRRAQIDCHVAPAR